MRSSTLAAQRLSYNAPIHDLSLPKRLLLTARRLLCDLCPNGILDAGTRVELKMVQVLGRHGLYVILRTEGGCSQGSISTTIGLESRAIRLFQDTWQAAKNNVLRRLKSSLGLALTSLIQNFVKLSPGGASAIKREASEELGITLIWATPGAGPLLDTWQGAAAGLTERFRSQKDRCKKMSASMCVESLRCCTGTACTK